MGVVIKAANTRAPWYAKVMPPAADTLQGWYEFGSDVKVQGFNRAMGKKNGVVIGSPTISAGYTRFKGLVNYLQTDISDTNSLTIVVVGRSANAIPAGAASTGDANTPFYAGFNRGNPQTPGLTGSVFGTGLYHIKPDALTSGSSRENGAGAISYYSTDLNGETPTNFALRAIRINASGLDVVSNLTRGVVATRTTANARVRTDSLARVGSGVTGFGADVDVSCVAFWSSALTDADLAAVGELMRKRAARYGINV